MQVDWLILTQHRQHTIKDRNNNNIILTSRCVQCTGGASVVFSQLFSAELTKFQAAGMRDGTPRAACVMSIEFGDVRRED